jgi:hypothetical protein
VDNAVMPHQLKRHQHLSGESADESCCETDKAISLYQLIEIDTE